MSVTLHSPWASLKQTWPIRKSEWSCAFGVCGLWLVMALRPEMFGTYSGYKPLAALAPQWVWQWFCFAIGFGRVVALFVNGGYYRTPHARCVFAYLSCFIWFSLFRGLSENLGIGMVLAAIPLFIDVANAKQSGHEAAASEGLRHAERHSIPRHR